MAVDAAILIPGSGYTTQAPLLFFCGMALRRRDLPVHPIEWAVPSALDSMTRQSFVAERVQPVLAVAGRRPLLVAKSLGSYAAPLAAQRGLPAIWLTPLLGEEAVVAALRAGSAPMLLVGGTADPLWDGPLARELTPHVYEVPDGDHSLMVPGSLADSARILGEAIAAVERFLDDVVMP